MPKNNLFIVIDSLYYDKTIGNDYHPATMPFLDKLRSEGITCTNMYSEAPYTEAALVSLLCGIDTLKNGSYIRKLYGKETIMETFRDNGYETFSNCVQPLVYPSYSYQGLTEEYYNICYEFETLWAYRLEFYSKEYKKNGLDDKTMKVIIDLINDNFITWINFLESLRDNKKITAFIYKYVDTTDVKENLKQVNDEYKKFNKNKSKYTKELLELGKEHPVFKIHTYNLSKKMTPENMLKLEKRYKKIITKMLFKNMFYNLRNNKLILTPKEDRKALIKSYINAIYNRFLYQKIDHRIKSKKAAPSMETTFLHFEDWLLKRQKDKPYFAYIHLDDCHRQEFFYTYDTNDFNKLDEEFKAIENYMHKLPKNYRGNLSYDVSLQYADICLRRLYTFLAEHKMLDNLNIFICADHGSSYTFDPYRKNYVNNEHRENYNMPFVIWSKDLKPEVINGMYNTKDIPATMLAMNNLSIPKTYDGMSILNNKPRDYVLLENVCGGCPDYNLRDFMLGIRNNNYVIVMNVNAHKEFSDGEILAIYDLKTDRQEKYNLKDTLDRSVIEKELKILKNEFEILKEDIKKHNFIDV